MDTAPHVENRAAANESHPGEQPLQHARLRVRTARESNLRDGDIPCRADGDERERTKPGAAILVLPVPRDWQRQRVCDGESQDQFERRRHGSILAPAGARSATHF